jgi:hypothetical protein
MTEDYTQTSAKRVYMSYIGQFAEEMPPTTS